MKFVEDIEFNKLVETYKKLPLEEKKKIVQNEFKELIAVLKEIDNDDEILYNKEMLDVEKEDQTEDDFVEATFVYLSSIKEVISKYLLQHLEKEEL